jgi:N-sulfoglucosamine sulfohydrolase
MKSLPHYMNEAGYRTGCIGKKHYAPEALFPFQSDMYDPDNIRNDVLMAEDCRGFIEQNEPFFLYWCSHNPHRGVVLEEHPLKPDDFGNLPNSESYEGDTVVAVPLGSSGATWYK